MGKKTDITKQRFGRLVAIKEAGINKHGKVLWICKCDCGKIKIINGCYLRNGDTKSCGCLNIDQGRAQLTTHGMSKTSTYKSWCHMLERCNNPKNFRYSDYGGRSIKVCKRWHSFENFFGDMGEKPEGLTLERINNDGNYEPGNCKWATYGEQSKNQRTYKNNKTGIAGVFWNKQCQKYQAYIAIDHKQYHLGLFADLKKAIIARKQAEIKYWGQVYG